MCHSFVTTLTSLVQHVKLLHRPNTWTLKIDEDIQMTAKRPNSRATVRRLKMKHLKNALHNLGLIRILNQFSLRAMFMASAAILIWPLLTCCSNNSQTSITPAPGSGGGPDPALTQSLPALDQKDMKATALNELMRAQSTSRYLINKPGSAPSAEGCVSYSKENVPGSYLSANYKCGWTEQARDNPNQKVSWTQSGTSTYSGDTGDSTESANLTLTARRVPKVNPKAAAKSVLATISYSRTVTIHPLDSNGRGLNASSTNAGDASLGPTTSPANPSPATAPDGTTTSELSALDVAASAPGSVTTAPPAVPPPPPRPTPPGHWHPTPTAPVQLASGSWSTTIDGYWGQPNDKSPMQLSLKTGSRIKFNYLPPSSRPDASPTVMTLHSLTEITFSSASACARPIGKFSYTITQADGTSSATQNFTADATGFSEDSNPADKYLWPTDSCLEFQQ